MYTTQELAARYGVTPQAINKYRRKIEEIERDRTGDEAFKLGQPDPRDARKVVFSETEIEMFLEMIPKSLQESKVIEPELVDEEDHITRSMHETSQAAGLIPFSFNQVNLIIQQVDTKPLEDETNNIRQQGSIALNVLRDAFKTHTVGRIQEGIKQIDHAAAALTTGALIDAVQDLQAMQDPKQQGKRKR